MKKIKNDCEKKEKYYIYLDALEQKIYSVDNFNVYTCITIVLPSVNRNDKFSNGSLSGKIKQKSRHLGLN